MSEALSKLEIPPTGTRLREDARIPSPTKAVHSGGTPFLEHHFCTSGLADRRARLIDIVLCLIGVFLLLVPLTQHVTEIVYGCAWRLHVPMTWVLLASLFFLVFWFSVACRPNSSSYRFTILFHGPFLFPWSTRPARHGNRLRLYETWFTFRRFGFLCGYGVGGCCLSSVPRSRLVLRIRLSTWSVSSH